jgi:hypothetical protein
MLMLIAYKLCWCRRTRRKLTCVLCLPWCTAGPQQVICVKKIQIITFYCYLSSSTSKAASRCLAQTTADCLQQRWMRSFACAIKVSFSSKALVGLM